MLIMNLSNKYPKNASRIIGATIDSERQDLNLRPLRPERSALAKLSYSP